MKYLFGCRFTDGTVYEQNAGDVSLYDPNRSCYFDVVNLMKEKQIGHFWLEGDGDHYEVNMIDGHFEVNGKMVNIHPQGVVPKNLELVYYRQRRHHRNVLVKDGDVVGILGSYEEEPVFFFGWRMKDDNDQDHQYTMSIT